MTIAERVKALRELMSQQNLAAYLVPSADPHMSEYVAECWQRRKFISGFDGSAGTVAVTAKQAGLWTDSRYFVQAEQQLQGSGIDLYRLGEADVPVMEAWLGEKLGSGDRVGLDTKTFSAAAYGKLAQGFEKEGIELVAMAEDLVEQVWGADRPALPSQAVRVHPPELAGESATEKLSRLGKAMADKPADAMVLCALDEIAWLFNLRGQDVDFNPVFIAYALIEKEGATLFVDPEKIGPAVQKGLGDKVQLLDYHDFEAALAALGAKSAKVWIDPATCSQWVAGVLKAKGAELIGQTGPVPAWKAIKNTAEINGMRAAHLRDGVALVKLLHWLEKNVELGDASEMTVVEKIRAFRASNDEFIGSSFDTISAYADHGAIVHYRVSEESNAALQTEGILLVDTGGQYRDGTTDVTRTLALGEPTPEQIRAYTGVLQGHLALTRAWFQSGADGYQLDVIARAPLWSLGLNYGHGTGHGVGAALCVHEGPFSVSPRKVLLPLEPGHILSIEPGFYQEGQFGIRIENLALVREVETTPSGVFLGFETLTLCPYQRKLIDIEMLCPDARAQIDQYHSQVREALSEFLDDEERAWLERETRPL